MGEDEDKSSGETKQPADPDPILEEFPEIRAAEEKQEKERERQKQSGS